MNRSKYYELREQATLVIQKQIYGILNDIIEDGCLSHNNSHLIEPIGRLWEILGLDWIKDTGNIPILDDEPTGDGDGSSG